MCSEEGVSPEPKLPSLCLQLDPDVCGVGETPEVGEPDVPSPRSAGIDEPADSAVHPVCANQDIGHFGGSVIERGSYLAFDKGRIDQPPTVFDNDASLLGLFDQPQGQLRPLHGQRRSAIGQRCPERQLAEHLAPAVAHHIAPGRKTCL